MAHTLLWENLNVVIVDNSVPSVNFKCFTTDNVKALE